MQVPPFPRPGLVVDDYNRRAAFASGVLYIVLYAVRVTVNNIPSGEVFTPIFGGVGAVLIVQTFVNTGKEWFALDTKLVVNQDWLRRRRQQALQQRGESDRQATRAHSDPRTRLDSTTCTPAALCRHPETALSFCPALGPWQCRAWHGVARLCCPEEPISSRGCGAVHGALHTAVTGVGGGAGMLWAWHKLHVHKAFDSNLVASCRQVLAWVWLGFAGTPRGIPSDAGE